MNIHRLATFLALMLSSIGAVADARDSYRQGVDAFHAGDYATAVSRFEAAEHSGMHDSRLTFNLGSSYFKLGKLDASRRCFSAIANDLQWGALAQFNLGLIDEREGHTDAAQSHFQIAMTRTDSERVRALARQKLRNTTDRASDTPPGWTGFASLGGGFDDNVVLSADPTILGVSDKGDAFANALLGASGYVAGSYNGGLRLDFGASGEAYRDLSDYDAANALVGLAYTKVLGGWFLDTGIRGDASSLGQELFTTSGAYRLRAYHPISENTGIQLRGEVSYISGASNYDYLTGWRQGLGAEFQIHHTTGLIRVGYNTERNNRDDLTTSTEFFSYSPTRNAGYLGIEQNLGKRVKTELYTEYRVSDYQDEDQVVDASGATIVEQRKDKLLSAGLRTAFNVTDGFGLFLDYRYTNNDSNFETDQYNANRVTLGLESRF